MTTDAPSTNNPLAAVWRWSLRHSPIMGLARAVGERVRRHRKAAALIQASDLPDSVRSRLRATVSRTQLRASEQADVARELIAHALDAAHAGRPEPEILAGLGDPRPVARLIRRAVKRKRPLPYQIRLWTARALLASVAGAVVLYLALLVRFYAGAPSIETDYLARLNARVHAMPDADKAWPVYREAITEWIVITERLRATSRVDAADADASYRGPAVDRLHDVPRDHPDYDATATAVRDFRPTLDRAASAASRPAFGILLSDRSRRIEIEGSDRWLEEPVEPAADPAQQESLISVLLPHLGHSRTLALLFAFDSRLAVDEADADRVARDIHALLDLSRQLRAEPTIIASLVAIGIHDLALRRIAEVIHDAPDLLPSHTLVELSHTIVARRDDTLGFDLDSERLFFQDILQRSFTDDGDGRGRLTPEGVRLIAQLSGKPEDFGALPEHDTPWLVRSSSTLAGPVVGVAVKGRAEQSRAHERVLSEAQRCLDAGPSALPELIRASEERRHAMDESELAWRPLADMLPNLTSAVAQAFTARASADATLALLAAAVYRAEHGRWPESLQQLVPRYLPSLPADPFDPGNSFRYRLEHGAPVIWSVGVDADDDQAQPQASRPLPRAVGVRDLRARFDEHSSRTRPDADWILFPPED